MLQQLFAKCVYRLWGEAGPRTQLGLEVLEDVNFCQPASGRQRALLCYLLSAFKEEPGSPEFRQHTNRWRAVTIAELMGRCGYIVDVVDWNSAVIPDVSNYQLIVGLGRSFEMAAKQRSRSSRAIYLGTGAPARQTNLAIRKRRKEAARRHGMKLRVSLLNKDHGPRYADLCCVVGNEWVKEQYKRETKTPLIVCPNSLTLPPTEPKIQEFLPTVRSPRNFIWMAAYGALHRRLDLVLEIFEKHPEWNLWICGNIEAEKGFFNLFKRQLTQLANIHLVGWVDIASSEFSELTQKCAFLVYPSVSDGHPGSVINTMSEGVIPLVTLEAGIDVEPFGEVFASGRLVDIEAMLEHVSNFSSAEIQERSRLASDVAQRYYTRQNFITAFESALDSILLDS